MYMQLRKTPRHQPVQKLLIRLIADKTTNEHYKFKLNVEHGDQEKDGHSQTSKDQKIDQEKS
ncbi:hypothetical protein DVH24_015003 [Malus domestica]|uniref:Uncharacterized protein n=1 Tax=Malus domestica TaxID=3750 RepID=A0A498K5V9_MALDO|nr:hypothetical protein DVH24_015003 [Malus domestica]